MGFKFFFHITKINKIYNIDKLNLMYIYSNTKKNKMVKKITVTESELIKLIEDNIEDVGYLDMGGDVDDEFEYYEPEEEEGDNEKVGEILSPEQIVGLLEDQIIQLQDRVQYSEELLADILEYNESLMNDLKGNDDLNLRKSSQKLRALETRAGREIFWLKSRRL